MDLLSIVEGIQASALAEWMRTSLKAMPVVNSMHVMAAVTVFGTILIVDLRLLGFTDARRSFARISEELLRFTWSAFVVALITGMLMFAANASTYIRNTAFGLKMLALLGAGVNMAIFQRVTFRSVAGWDSELRPPLGARIAGAASILIWLGVIFFARWIGFTKGYDFVVPENVEVDFEF
jgi:hypothetical protein